MARRTPLAWLSASPWDRRLPERLLAARFGRSLVDHRIWLVADHAPTWSAAPGGRPRTCRRRSRSRPAGTIWPRFAKDDQSFAPQAWPPPAGPCGRWTQHDTHAAEAALAACLRAHKPTLVLAIGAETPPDGGAPDASPDTPPNPRGAAARRAWLKRLRRHANREAFQNALTGHLPARLAEGLPSPTRRSNRSHAAVRRAHRRPRPPRADPARAGDIAAERGPAPAAAPHIAPFAAGALDMGRGWTRLPPACLLGMSLHGGILPVSQTAARHASKLPRAAWRHGRAPRPCALAAHDRPRIPSCCRRCPNSASPTCMSSSLADRGRDAPICLDPGAAPRQTGPASWTLPADTQTRGLPASPAPVTTHAPAHPHLVHAASTSPTSPC